MPKNDVLVDGVRLTREQIERAQRELNEPDPYPYKGGELVEYCYDEWIVVKPSYAPHLQSGEVAVLSPRDGSIGYVRPNQLTLITSVYDKHVVLGRRAA